jgi:hypothetical protein
MGFRTPSVDPVGDQFPALLSLAPPEPRNPFEKVMRQVQHANMQAWRTVNEECYAVEAWDSAAAESLDRGTWRRELLAADRSGALRHAWLLAQQAAALARTPPEQYRAALVLACLSCEAGHHEVELAQVRRLMALAPRSQVSLMMLQRAAQRNGMTSLERQADAMLKALQEPCVNPILVAHWQRALSASLAAPQFAVRKFSIR